MKGIIAGKKGVDAGCQGINAGSQGVVDGTKAVNAGTKAVITVGQAVIGLSQAAVAASPSAVWRISCLPAIVIGIAPWQAGVNAIPAAFHVKIFLVRYLTTNVNKKVLETAK